MIKVTGITREEVERGQGARYERDVDGNPTAVEIDPPTGALALLRRARVRLSGDEATAMWDDKDLTASDIQTIRQQGWHVDGDPEPPPVRHRLQQLAAALAALEARVDALEAGRRPPRPTSKLEPETLLTNNAGP